MQSTDSGASQLTVQAERYDVRLRWTVTLLLVSAFGPYFPSGHGVRLEHLVIYGMALWIAVKELPSLKRENFNLSLLFLAGCFLSAAILGLLTTLLSPSEWISKRQIIADLENYLQPAAILVTMTLLMGRSERKDCVAALQSAAFVTVLLLSINSLIAAASLVVDTAPVVKYFVMGSGDKTVWARAAIKGRYSGIFNQPTENGVAYSIALFSWVYWSAARKKCGWFAWCLLALLLFGGLLAQSKVFIVFALPTALLYAFWVRLHSQMTLTDLWRGALMLTAIGFVFKFSDWKGMKRLLRIFDPDFYNSRGGFFMSQIWTRYGEEGAGVLKKFQEVNEASPIYGFGFGYENALDSAYLMHYFHGGLLGLGIYASIIAGIWWMIGLGFFHLQKGLSGLLTAIGMLVVVAGLGAPVLTMNRSSILLWVLFALGSGILAVDSSCRRRRDALILDSKNIQAQDQ